MKSIEFSNALQNKIKIINSYIYILTILNHVFFWSFFLFGLNSIISNICRTLTENERIKTYAANQKWQINSNLANIQRHICCIFVINAMNVPFQLKKQKIRLSTGKYHFVHFNRFKLFLNSLLSSFFQLIWFILFLFFLPARYICNTVGSHFNYPRLQMCQLSNTCNFVLIFVYILHLFYTFV